uniref:[Ribosomal protein bS18]-alanine N-acetyltransferase n=1 Tax=Candidatus Kentrum eta TaxID=2126337 RepID=A0A450VGB1_9GAMM|nr:MAG: ribosomal-protein-alanine N-acetyltransferase [Candidatus Kentron sp. H]VFJ99164.1 MAG: ribosomal-protein-alanine N-acetyltransferase [Candidatus Kentron sp. H]VFK03805.1 MAG: ribosomal-protein-alanine N-acetyltransferase [Candidatus Kentron sp. H]
MTEDDLDAVLELERAAYPFPWTVGMFRDCLRIGYCCQVLDDPQQDRNPLGYGIMSVGGGEAQLLNLCIRQEERNQSLARRLLIGLIDMARERRADVMFLEVRPSNRAARALYGRVGFNEVGVRPGYYPVEEDGKKGWEDALILGLTLSLIGRGE